MDYGIPQGITQEELDRINSEKRRNSMIAGISDALGNSQSAGNFALGKMNPGSSLQGLAGNLNEQAEAPIRDKAALLKAYQDKMAMQKSAMEADVNSDQNKAWRESTKALLGRLSPDLAASVSDRMTSSTAPEFLKQVIPGEYGIKEKQIMANAELGKLKAQQPQKSLEAASKLREEYQGLQTVKNSQLLSESVHKMREAAKDSTPASDMSLIYGFMKLQDPNSTVREGEYATAQNARGVESAVMNAYNQMLSGQKLTPEQRRDFLNQGEKTYGAQISAAQNYQKKYGDLSQKYGVDPSMVLTQFEPAQGEQTQKTPQQLAMEEMAKRRSMKASNGR